MIGDLARAIRERECILFAGAGVSMTVGLPSWRTLMEQCLIRIYGEEVGMHEAEAMMILIAGTFICNYNQALTGEINDNILGYLGNLSRS